MVMLAYIEGAGSHGADSPTRSIPAGLREDLAQLAACRVCMVSLRHPRR